MACSLLLNLFLVATLAAFAAASGYPSSSQQSQEQQPAGYLSSSSSNHEQKGFNFDSCDGTKEALLEARDKCCNDLGKHGGCICSAAKKVADSVTFLQLCNSYDACSSGSGSWIAGTGDDVATSRKSAAECSLAHLDSTAEHCSEAVKVLKEHKGCFDSLALLKKSSGDDSFTEALGKLGLEDFAGVIEKLFPVTPEF